MWDVLLVLVIVAQYLQNSRFVAPFGYLLLYGQNLFNAKLSKHVNSLLCHEENQPNCTYWLVKQKRKSENCSFSFFRRKLLECAFNWNLVSLFSFCFSIDVKPIDAFHVPKLFYWRLCIYRSLFVQSRFWANQSCLQNSPSSFFVGHCFSEPGPGLLAFQRKLKSLYIFVNKRNVKSQIKHLPNIDHNSHLVILFCKAYISFPSLC